MLSGKCAENYGWQGTVNLANSGCSALLLVNFTLLFWSILYA
jgi:hypothetical protein